MRQFTLLKDLPPIATQGMIFVPDGRDYREIMNRAVFVGSYVENNPDLFHEHKDTEESSKPFDEKYVTELLQDFVMESARGSAERDSWWGKIENYIVAQNSKQIIAVKGTANDVPNDDTFKIVFSRTDSWQKNIDILKNAMLKEGYGLADIPPNEKPPKQNSEGKDWEIVEFRNPYNYPILKCDNGQWYLKGFEVTNGSSYEEVLEGVTVFKLNKIHSVKRLSDGEVFSVGDNNEYPTGIIDKIKEFKIEDTKRIDGEMDLFFRTDSIWSHIRLAKKPQPQPQQESKIKDQIVIDLQEMRKDKSGGSYYYSWQANIAVAFQDAYREEFGDSPRMRHIIHDVSNNAAKRFLDQLIHIPSDETI